MDTRSSEQIIPFSAFWLRSSVVSVLISLISDFPTTRACSRGFSCVAFALHYCKGLAHPTNLSSIFLLLLLYRAAVFHGFS
ncbi:hypothetical protein LINGRAHAP2_LOCUS28271 [Linum grandiflorum]